MSIVRKLSAVAAIFLSLFLTTFSTGGLANSYTKGQHIEPAYEGWRHNADGTFSFMFGYMNINWEEEPDVEIGPNNAFAPG